MVYHRLYFLIYFIKVHVWYMISHAVTVRGIRIRDISYNVFCYAADILICRNTSIGLQKLIDVANPHVTIVCKYGQSINPTKTECDIGGGGGGKCTLQKRPQWFI